MVGIMKKGSTSLPAGLEGGGEVIPSGRLPSATRIDDAGEQRKRSSYLVAAGTEAQATGDDPVAQQTFGRIVGERQAGVE
jgi:hypothetical protein